MKRAVDKGLGVLFGIIAVYAGFAVLGSLVEPYVAWIVGAVVFVIIIAGLAVALPGSMSLGTTVVERYKKRKEDPWSGSE